jgi:hypothetical protein
MTLLNQHWQSLTGKPVTGRMPPALHVTGDVHLTSEQLGAVANAYQVFCNTVAVSIAGHHVAQRTLLDGTKVRMVSNNGRDEVFVDPPAVGTSIEYEELFRAITANATHVNGVDSGAESKKWRLGSGVPSALPSVLKDASDEAHHPGHVRWFNPALKFGGKPLIVSWRGPRSRYASTLGWSTRTGGTQEAHNDYEIDLTVTRDTSYVWINGRRIDTGVQKIIAACLHCPDPSGHPGAFVLRVCTDYASSGVRGLKVVDLVAASGASGSGLEKLHLANTLYVKSTYTAADFVGDVTTASGANKWDMLQRPHFNASGTRLASIIKLVDGSASSTGTFGVAFDPTDWSIQSTINTPTLTSRSQTTTGTDHVDITIATDHVDNATLLVAVDFDGDTLVYISATSESHVVGSDHRYSSVGGVAVSAQDVSTTEDYAFTLTHSAIGVLHVLSETITNSSSYVNDGVHIVYSLSRGSTKLQMFAFAGDLSVGTMAIGYSDAAYSDSGSGGGTVSHTASPPFIVPGCITVHKERLLFDVYLDGSLVAAATTGAFTNAAPSSHTEDAAISSVDASTTMSPDSSSSSSTLGGGGMTTEGSTYMHPSEYVHVAVRSDRKIAYLGGSFYQLLDFADRSLSTPAYGVELAVFNPATGIVLENPPAYAGGTRPTLTTPVFTGLQAIGARQ